MTSDSVTVAKTDTVNHIEAISSGRGVSDLQVHAWTDVRESNSKLMVRLAHACFALGIVATLLLARWLVPDPRGLGTHEQLLLMPCNFHLLTGLPCPFCGMTTAFAYMAHGDVGRAFLAQPLGALGFIASLLMLPIAIGAAVLSKNAIGAAMRFPWGRLSWVLVGMVVGAWAFKLALTLEGHFF